MNSTNPNSPQIYITQFLQNQEEQRIKMEKEQRRKMLHQRLMNSQENQRWQHSNRDQLRRRSSRSYMTARHAGRHERKNKRYQPRLTNH